MTTADSDESPPRARLQAYRAAIADVVDALGGRVAARDGRTASRHQEAACDRGALGLEERPNNVARSAADDL